MSLHLNLHKVAVDVADNTNSLVNPKCNRKISSTSTIFAITFRKSFTGINNKKGGIEMALEFIKLNVEGMSCSHCENAAKKAVGALTGVDNVAVNLQEKTVTVEFDPGKVTVIQIKEAIDDQGYEVE